MLAAASIGAVWSSCSPDFGVQGVLDRFGQIEPKVLIACDGYYYAGKSDRHLRQARRDRGQAADAARRHRRALSRQRRCRGAGPQRQPDPQGRAGADLARCRHAPCRQQPLRFERLPFSHPLYVLFSSGTTGMPKCIVHSAGGTLLKHLSEQLLHSDIRPGDRVFYFTTLGWMMWNWLVSGLASGATLLLYDGSPFHPTATCCGTTRRPRAPRISARPPSTSMP